MRTCLQIIAFSLIGVGFFPHTAAACSCAPLSAPEQFSLSDVVFLGRVVDARPLAYVLVEVRETFKGQAAGRLRIPTGRNDCDYFLPPVVAERGTDFLIYAARPEKELVVTRCFNSGPASTKADEIARLRRLSGGAPSKPDAPFQGRR